MNSEHPQKQELLQDQQQKATPAIPVDYISNQVLEFFSLITLILLATNQQHFQVHHVESRL